MAREPTFMTLFTPIEKISRITPFYRKKLKKIGINTLYDLFFHFPHRYEDFSKITPISEIKIQENNCIQGKILEIKNTRTWKKRMILTQAVVSDDTSAIKVVWFNQPYLTRVLKKGDLVSLAGKVTIGEGAKNVSPEVYLSNPAYEKIKNSDLTHTGRIVPIYPETEGLSSRWLRTILKSLLSQFKEKIPETLPEKIRKKYHLLPIQEAIWQIHFPDSLSMAEEAQKRFSFEEIFSISLLALREKIRLSKEKAIPVPLNVEVLKKFVSSLPFKLTNAQRKCAWQILRDMQKPWPMNRLLEGDVGSGKTVVGVMAMLNNAKAGFQSTLMAPTEILAKQHFKTISTLLQDFNLNIGLLTGKEDKFVSKKLKGETIEISRKKLLEKTLKGEIDILIGTHTLIQDKVKFKNLTLVIVDEQHRFGVEQRAKLCSPRSSGQRFIPHLLSMTATPIPRTLSLTLYGDLDLSLLDELPKGRKKVITKIIPPEEREKTYEFIRSEVRKGRQVFVICPRIEAKINENETTTGTETKAVKEEYEKLSKKIFPDLKVGMLHGKMTPKQKEKIMKDFKEKKIDILVTTSVVEVGIDIPNATVMMIEGAERFGLAQLHQFRGRVGRSKYQSFCFLFPESFSKKTELRLKAFLTCEDGFALAEKDLQIRGPGDLFGTRQWGIPDLAMSSLKDLDLVEKTREAAKEILEEDPELKKYPFLAKKINIFRKKIHLE